MLERGERPASALRRVDPDLRLLTPRCLSTLPHQRLAPGAPQYLSFGRLADELEAYREAEGVGVEQGVEVVRVARGDAGFEVQAADGRRWTAARVIDATGVLCTPRLPAGADALRARWLHARDVRREDLAGARRLLLVGAGVSARELVEAWVAVRPAGAEGYLSLRSPLREVPHRVLGLVDVHWLVWPLEFLPARLPGARWLLRREPAIGRGLGRALRRGELRRVGGFEGARDGAAVCGGEALDPDLVVFATGYERRAAHLGELIARDARGLPLLRACESTRAPGLYLLGVRFGRSLASPFLRGIARDAAHVARRVAREVRP